MKEFVRSAKQEDSPVGDEPLQFTVGGDVFTVYPPTTAMFALFMASQSDTREPTDQIAGLVDFLDNMLSPEDRIMFRQRLLDREHPLEFSMLEDIVGWLVEEWSARPTKSQQDSSSPPVSTGRKSTAKPRSRARASSA